MGLKACFGNNGLDLFQFQHGTEVLKHIPYARRICSQHSCCVSLSLQVFI